MARVLDRLGRGSFRHRWIVLVAWLLVLAAAAFGAVASGLNISDSFSIPGTESQRAQELVAERLGDQAADVGSDSSMSAQQGGDTSSARVVVGAPEGESFLTGTGIPDVLTALAPVSSAEDVVAVSDPVAAQAVAPDGSVMYVDVSFGVGVDDIPDATTTAIEDAAASPRGRRVRGRAGRRPVHRAARARGADGGDRARRRADRARRDVRVAPRGRAADPHRAARCRHRGGGRAGRCPGSSNSPPRR